MFPLWRLASIFANTDQSQHTLTAIFAGHHHASTAYDGTIAEGCQCELASIASALIDDKEGVTKWERVHMLWDVTAPIGVWWVQIPLCSGLQRRGMLDIARSCRPRPEYRQLESSWSTVALKSLGAWNRDSNGVCWLLAAEGVMSVKQ